MPNFQTNIIIEKGGISLLLVNINRVGAVLLSYNGSRVRPCLPDYSYHWEQVDLYGLGLLR